jgi:hypothetical protein
MVVIPEILTHLRRVVPETRYLMCTI